MKHAIKLITGAALLAALPIAANAESQFVTGGSGSATAHLDFKIVIPQVLFLQVGTGTAFANNTAVDLIEFDVPAASVATGTPVAATASSGDLGNGTVTAKVFGNKGAISLSSATTGALSDGTGDSISYSNISTAAATLSSTTALPAPALADGATTSINLTPTSGTKVTNLDAKWTYTYANTAEVPQGTYGGVNTNGSRVTYTASMP